MSRKAFSILAFVLVLLFITTISVQANGTTVEVFTDQSTFLSTTGAVAVSFPTDAGSTLSSTPFSFNDHSCTDNNTGIDLGMVTITAPAANNWICLIGPGWNAGPNNVNPLPTSPTIVANGEDDYHVVSFAEPVSAVGFELLTNSSASESITFIFGDGGSQTIGDSDLDTNSNQFEFVGFRATKPIVSVELDTTGGASQNEGIAAIWTFVDKEGPVTSNVVANPNPVTVDGSMSLTANVDDTTTGGSHIVSAEYGIDGGAWNSMDADDGAFDEVSEDVSGNFTAPGTPGIFDLCVRGTDAAGNTGDPECVMLVVYDPDGGFVTGGGWITSSEGAMPPTVTPVTISGVSGDSSVDPDATHAPYMLRHVGDPPPTGYDPLHDYQWASPAIFTPSPEDSPVTLSGSIEVGNQSVGNVAMIGLLDRDDLAAGNTSFQRGVYIYVYRNTATSWRIGPSDGNADGEIVQSFITVSDANLPLDGTLDVVFTVDGTADGTACAVGTFTAPAGCMTLQISGGSVNATLTDSYGDLIGDDSASPEFTNGAVLGWDDYVGSNVGYKLTVPSMTSGSPEGRANFGFVSKYKKGANVPTGNTEFQFKAADLNFHSNVQEWLVVTGSNYAKFKGEGTINRELAPNDELYKFQLWAGDETGDNGEDTFRIKIWWEEGEVEHVVYDNGMDQAIGGGNIVVHSK